MEKKVNTRIRRRNNGIRKLFYMFILFIITIIAFLKIIMPATVTLSRYTYGVIKANFLESRSFYFNSDKLNNKGTAYFESDNWSGNSEYQIDVTMNSKKNLTKFSDYDINYKIDYSYELYTDKDVKLSANDYFDFKMDGNSSGNTTGISRTIYSAKGPYGGVNTDKISFYVQPGGAGKSVLKDGYYIIIKIKAYTEKPYKESLTGTVKIVVGSLGLSYAIEDSTNSEYLNLIVTNTKDNYIVETPFSLNAKQYNKNDSLTIHQYLDLLNIDSSIKDKCFSMYVSLDFDVDKVVLDTASHEYIYASQKGNSFIKKNVRDGNTFVDGITFRLDAEESTVIKFYKTDITQDYTFPDVNSTSIISVTEATI